MSTVRKITSKLSGVGFTPPLMNIQQGLGLMREDLTYSVEIARGALHGMERRNTQLRRRTFRNRHRRLLPGIEFPGSSLGVVEPLVSFRDEGNDDFPCFVVKHVWHHFSYQNQPSSQAHSLQG